MTTIPFRLVPAIQQLWGAPALVLFVALTGLGSCRTENQGDDGMQADDDTLTGGGGAAGTHTAVAGVGGTSDDEADSGTQAGTGGSPQGGESEFGGAAAGHQGNTGGMGGAVANMGGVGTAGSGGHDQAKACVAPACDDFETYEDGQRPAGPWHNFEVTSNGALAIDNGRAFSGSKSVKFTMNPGSEKRARMQHQGSGLLPRPEIYMRAMVYVDAPITGRSPFHWSFFRVETQGFAVVTGGNTTGKMFQHFVGGGRDCYANGAAALPTGRWTCIEFHVNGQTDDAQTFVNGKLDEFTEIARGSPIPGSSGCLSGSSTGWQIPNASTLWVGFTMHHSLDAPAAMWMDDVEVSDKPIGCPQ